jgi:hypothetical protein
MISGIALLMLFSFYYSGITLFSYAHTHDQSTVVHSHPYKKGANGESNHTHTQAETILIAGLLHLLAPATIAVATSISLFIIFFREIITDLINSKLLGAFKELFNLRSPPFSPAL